MIEGRRAGGKEAWRELREGKSEGRVSKGTKGVWQAMKVDGGREWERAVMVGQGVRLKRLDGEREDR